ncbi:MAG TPA: FG-GAP-like repeat-containing protein [candidate division Zixibacteria bacterium]
MTKKLFILVILLLVAVPAFAEVIVDTAWVRRYNGSGNNLDEAVAIAVDTSGNVYVTGYSVGIGTGNDYVTIKYYPDGDTAWVRRYNGPVDSADVAEALAIDASGNVYVTGASVGTGGRDSWPNYDYATIKYYPNGDTAWVRRYNGPGNDLDVAYALAVDRSGNVLVTGGSYGIGTGGDYATIKYYPDGDTAWVRRYIGPGSTNNSDFALALAVDGSGNIYLTGYSNGSESICDYATVKYYPNGDTAWVRRYNNNDWDWANAIAVDGWGNVYVTGTSIDSATSNDYATVKYYPNGDTAWARTYGSPAPVDDEALGIALDDSGNVYVTGRSCDTLMRGWDYGTIKYHPNGDTAWVRTYNGPGNYDDVANDIAVDDSGNVYVTGYSYGEETVLSYAPKDYATIKYHPNGDTAWVIRYNGPGNHDDVANDIAVDGFGNVYVTGGSWGNETNYDYATIKYVQSTFEPRPHVVSTFPMQNQLNVPVNTNISVIFDMDMDQTTINDSTFVVNAWSTGLHQGAITYDGPTKTATLNPNVDFDVGEIVTVVLTNGIKSSDGTPMDSSYVWSFTTKVEDGTGCFAPAVNYSTGDGPNSVFGADLDGDGDLDLAVANAGSGNVSILKNNGDGTFQAKVDYGTGSAPTSVFCADLDGDGDLDLAVANCGSDNISILKNNGDGTFQTNVDYGAGDCPLSVFCADLDGDGYLDLAVANCSSDTISILKNNGDGSFQANVDYLAGDYPISVFCADLDGDSDLDLAVANNGSDNVSILKNNGDGTFQTKVDYGTGYGPLSLFCADLDGDSDMDLAVANFYYVYTVSILKNNGDGTFQSAGNYGAVDYPLSVFCADLDGDLDLDLAVANGSDNVSILKNNGDGSFQTNVDYLAGDFPISVFCADLDGDGDLDLAVANFSGDSVSILLNIRRGDCTGDKVVDVGDVVSLINYLFKSGTAPVPLPVGDVNCDGVDDVGDVVYLINYLFKGGPPPCC